MRILLSLSLALATQVCAQTPMDPFQTLTVIVPTPNPCWDVKINAVHRSGDALLVVARMQPPDPDLACAQVISEASDSVDLTLTGTLPPVRYLILGHPWEQAPDDLPDSYTFVTDEQELLQRLKGNEPVYSRSAD